MRHDESMKTRTETDSIGPIEVPADHLWGAQTQRSLQYFSIGTEIMPIEIILALARIKKAAAIANAEIGVLEMEKRHLIARAADEILEGKHDSEFPLHVWMTGSGTQSNMNVNEVISNLASDFAGTERGSKSPVHPNDDVNASQSSNDVFPTAIHIAVALQIRGHVIPAVSRLRDTFRAKSEAWDDIVKIGRTHLQDAVPMTLGQEFGGYASMLDDNLRRMEHALAELYPLCLGGTAIGTGLNAPAGFDRMAIREIAHATGLPFTPVADKFAAQGSHDALTAVGGHFKTLGTALYKIANDIRLLACGPRAGLNEIVLPANEPGSSIMPGKVNPTQCEALAMVGVQVMANDLAGAFGVGSGYLEMNVYKPLIGYNLLQSGRILGDSMNGFSEFCVEGMEPNRERIGELMSQSLMLVTALAPEIGYDQAAKVAKHAHESGGTLKESALELGVISEEAFDAAMDPLKMAKPHQG